MQRLYLSRTFNKVLALEKSSTQPTLKRKKGDCQGASKTRSMLDIWVPVELGWIYEGSLKGNASQLND